jgi:glycosyltransferase involved in cell wall biosynthesis
VKISAVLITFNEESNIADALRSVAWADERLVIDSQSTDRTVEIAREMGARVIVNSWPGFSAQKQFGADAASNDWILSLDADERVTPELASEIAGLNESSSVDGYRIPRLSTYMGREIRHSGWYPDRQMRLFDRRSGRWNGRVIHESFELSSGASAHDLRNPLRHFSVTDSAHHHRMIGERYAPLAAQQMYESGRQTSEVQVALAGPSAFLRSYFLRLGFLDGFAGYCIARFAAHNAYLKHLILLELQQNASREKAKLQPITGSEHPKNRVKQ